ncbi:MAG: hypothetical protein K8H86_10875 [Ignavibacteriaceae bacterium]|nr:hypothetical protein [Ignavibacteriaceae bacterium]
MFFIFPVTFNSEVTILPPEKNSELGGLGTLLGGDGFSSLITGGMGTANSQLFMEIIKSRTASLYVVDKFNLKKFYNKKNRAAAGKELNNDLSIEVTKEGIVKLGVDVSTGFFPFFNKSEVDSVRSLSAAISNGFVEALDKINREKLSSKARSAREYIELQLVDTKVKLDSAEQQLADFQQRNKTIALPEQLKASMETAAKLKAEIVKTEVEFGFIQNNVREDNKSYLALKNKLDELRGQYNKMEIGSNDFLLAFDNVPELGKKLARLMRAVKIQNEVYLLLEQQYFKEKIQEKRDIPTVEILDEAIPPLKASSPRTIFSSVVGGIFVLLLLSLMLLIKEKKIIELRSKKE